MFLFYKKKYEKYAEKIFLQFGGTNDINVMKYDKINFSTRKNPITNIIDICIFDSYVLECSNISKNLKIIGMENDSYGYLDFLRSIDSVINGNSLLKIVDIIAHKYNWKFCILNDASSIINHDKCPDVNFYLKYIYAFLHDGMTWYQSKDYIAIPNSIIITKDLPVLRSEFIVFQNIEREKFNKFVNMDFYQLRNHVDETNKTFIDKIIRNDMIDYSFDTNILKIDDVFTIKNIYMFIYNYKDRMIADFCDIIKKLNKMIPTIYNESFEFVKFYENVPDVEL